MAARGQSGSVILAALLGLLLLAGGAVYLFLHAPSATRESSAGARAVYDEAVSKLEQAMGDPRSVEASLGRNSSSFHCLYTALADCTNQGGPFLLYQSDTQGQAVSQLASDTGWSATGAACKGYPSEACPIHSETVWQPVCAGARCENTRSFRVSAKVTLHKGAAEAPLEWTRQELFSPTIQLSQAATCERGGGVWANTECLTPTQASERQIASTAGLHPPTREASSETPNAIPEQPVPVQYDCPSQIVVQGQFYPVQFLSADRAQVSVPAMSCQTPGVFDIFIFQCAAKSNPSYQNEGQWVQVEAVMAPACDAAGQALGEGTRL